MISASSSTSFQTRSVFGPILPINDSVFTSLNLVPIKSDLLRKAGSTCSVVKLRIYRRQKNRRAHQIFRFAQSAQRNTPQTLSRFVAGYGRTIYGPADQRVHVDPVKT